jgi:hypothetical protein
VHCQMDWKNAIQQIADEKGETRETANNALYAWNLSGFRRHYYEREC